MSVKSFGKDKALQKIIKQKRNIYFVQGNYIFTAQQPCEVSINIFIYSEELRGLLIQVHTASK